MKRLPILLALTLALTVGLALPAYADIWKWVDANGKTHFVDTTTAIYTWIDELGKVHYSDTPGHEDAVLVQLVWHSPGKLADAGDADDETPEHRGDQRRQRDGTARSGRARHQIR